MGFRHITWNAAILLLAVTGCVNVADDNHRYVTEEQASAALLDLRDLPGSWRPTAMPERGFGAVSKSATGGSACGSATRTLMAASAKWGEADIDVEVAYAIPTSAGELLLKQQIDFDPDLEAEHLVGPLRRQADACRSVVLVDGDEVMESSLRECNPDRAGQGVHIVQSWRTSDGRAGSIKFVYLFRGHLLVVVTLTSAESGASCDDVIFGHLVEAAVKKLGAAGL